MSCPFCDVAPALLVAESEHGLALGDAHPVSEGHTLIVPRRHVGDLLQLPEGVRADIWMLVARVRAMLARAAAPGGFTIGVDDGEAAGQTVGHAHIHVIPRRSGDVPNPRGGVPSVIPNRGAYSVPYLFSSERPLEPFRGDLVPRMIKQDVQPWVA